MDDRRHGDFGTRLGQPRGLRLLVVFIDLSHKAHICLGCDCPLISKSMTLFSQLSTMPLASDSSTHAKPCYPDKEAVPWSHELFWLPPPKPYTATVSLEVRTPAQQRGQGSS
jgi:hypothetical protein